MLGHQYTPENFSIDNLKLNDRAKAEALLLAAEKAGYYAKMCLVTSYVAGTPEYDDGYYDDYDTDMGEVYEESLTIEHWLTSDVPSLEIGNLDQDDLLTSFSTCDDEPLVAESSGYMGNYGPDIMHWYHYGAIMIWSPNVSAELLSSQYGVTQLNWIKYFVTQSYVSDIEQIAVQNILTNGLQNRPWSRESGDFNVVVQWIIWRNDKTFLLKLSSERLQFFFEKIDSEYWILLFEFMQVQATIEVYEKIIENITISVLEKHLSILTQMKNSEDLSAVALEQISALPIHFKKLYTQSKKRINAEALSNVFKLAVGQTDQQWTNQLTEALFINPKWDYFHHVLAPILIKTRKSFEFSEQLHAYGLTYLQDRIANKPHPPKDWVREIPDSKFPIPQWEILRPFMESPDEVVFDFRKKKDERIAMEEVINSVTIDLAMKTITSGSPHTLRIMKTQGFYDRKMKKWHKDVALLERLK